jgi:prepilin-type N-terminal cleavage/methylation domain-containing protein
MFNKNKKEEGFTLIELMVVLVIMVALIILVLSGYSESRPRLAIERTVEAFISNISLTREKSLNFLAYDDGESINSCNYGIYLEEGKSNYLLFADDNLNKNYSSGETILETVEIEKPIKIKEISKSGTEISQLSIVFSVEEGNAYFDGAEGGNATITFSSDSEDLERIITINSFGIVEISY